MARHPGHALWVAVSVCVLGVSAGCSPSSFYFFLPENKSDPELHRLANDDSKKDVRVVILTYSNKLETRPELLGADRDLTQQFATKLREGCETNKEHVVIVSPRKVEEFKIAHPGWSQADLSEIGRHFKADYVIYLEINRLSLFNKADMNTQYKGHAEISVSLIDVNQPDVPPEHKEFTCSYPSDARAIPVDADNPISQFREQFFNHVSKKLSWYFTEHLPREGYYID
jgi:hypothetical protein